MSDKQKIIDQMKIEEYEYFDEIASQLMDVELQDLGPITEAIRNAGSCEHLKDVLENVREALDGAKALVKSLESIDKKCYQATKRLGERLILEKNP